MSTQSMLKIDNLHASVEGKKILNGLSLSVARGEVHAIMGPNGSGKSTLANVLAGRPGYEVSAGSVSFEGRDLLQLPAEERRHKYRNNQECNRNSDISQHLTKRTPALPQNGAQRRPVKFQAEKHEAEQQPFEQHCAPVHADAVQIRRPAQMLRV
jgi:ABC-type branched-subunit amino acid transport system ATPase component